MPNPISELRALADEAAAFATAAAGASNLPGGQFGPRDAFRHIVGSAELTRRIGLLPAYTVTEANEADSMLREQWRIYEKRHVQPSLRADARAMDRSNNAVGHRIGLRVLTPDAVIEAAKTEIDRAHQLGPLMGSSGDRAGWYPPDRWVEPELKGDGTQNWPPTAWPDIAADPAVRAYPGHATESRYRRDRSGGGPVQVAPHVSEGYAVRGYTRAAPAY